MSEDSGQIAGFVEHGSGCYFQTHAEFVGYNSGKSGLAQSGRTEQEHVVECFGAHFCRSGENAQVFNYFILAVEGLEATRTERFLELRFCSSGALANVEFFLFHKLQKDGVRIDAPSFCYI